MRTAFNGRVVNNGRVASSGSFEQLVVVLDVLRKSYNVQRSTLSSRRITLVVDGLEKDSRRRLIAPDCVNYRHYIYHLAPASVIISNQPHPPAQYMCLSDA